MDAGAIDEVAEAGCGWKQGGWVEECAMLAGDWRFLAMNNSTDGKLE